jgi:hypothetical protein
MWSEKSIGYEPNDLLVRWLCPFIDPRTWLIMFGSRVPTLYTFSGCFPWQAHQWLALEDLEAHRSLEMCSPPEARWHACQLKLLHVCIGCCMSYEPLSKLWTKRLPLTERCSIARTMLHTILESTIVTSYLQNSIELPPFVVETITSNYLQHDMLRSLTTLHCYIFSYYHCILQKD